MLSKEDAFDDEEDIDINLRPGPKLSGPVDDVSRALLPTAKSTAREPERDAVLFNEPQINQKINYDDTINNLNNVSNVKGQNATDHVTPNEVVSAPKSGAVSLGMIPFFT